MIDLECPECGSTTSVDVVGPHFDWTCESCGSSNHTDLPADENGNLIGGIS